MPLSSHSSSAGAATVANWLFDGFFVVQDHHGEHPPRSDWGRRATDALLQEWDGEAMGYRPEPAEAPGPGAFDAWLTSGRLVGGLVALILANAVVLIAQR